MEPDMVYSVRESHKNVTGVPNLQRLSVGRADFGTTVSLASSVMNRWSRKPVLVVEDDAAIRAGIVDALEMSGFDPLQAATAAEARELALSCECQLILLDLVLPGGDGLDILAEVNRARPTLPVIIMTARGDERDRIRGLKLGADDYVVKPFSVNELLARIEAVLRRAMPGKRINGTIALPHGMIDLEQGEIRFGDGDSHTLSDRESELVYYLAQHADRAVSRDEILERVWRIDPAGLVTRTIDMHIARLRQKLRDDPNAPAILKTVRGKGYMWCHEADDPATQSASVSREA